MTNNRRSTYQVLFCNKDFRVGGFSTHSLTLAAELRKRGCCVIAFIEEPFGLLYREFRETFHEVVVVRRGLERRQSYLSRVIARLTGLRPDAIINNGSGFVQAAFRFIPRSIVRIAMIQNVLEREVQAGLAHAEGLNAVIGISKGVTDMLKARAPHLSNIATICSALPSRGLEVVRDQPRYPLRIIFVGRLHYQKNLPALVEIADNLRSAGVAFKLIVVGDGPEKNDLARGIRNRNLSNVIEVLGAKSYREIASLLNDNDYFLMTSRFEGTPNTVLEAMRSGLVVLASSLPGSTDEIITDEVDGFLCDPNEPGSYVRVLKELSNNPHRYASLSKAAQSTVRRRFDIHEVAEQYLSLIEKGLSSGGLEGDTLVPKRIEIPQALDYECHGLLKQVRHRLVDLVFRGWIKGEHPVTAQLDANERGVRS